MKAFIAIPDFSPDAQQLLRSAGIEFSIASSRPDEEELCRAIASFDALVIGARERMTERVHSCSRGPLFLGTLSIGTDHIDASFFSDRSVALANCPESNVRSVAEHTLGLIICLAKQIVRGHLSSSVGQGRSGLSHSPIDIEGRNLGVLGAGRIGTEVVRLASSIGMTVKCFTFSPENHPEIRDAGGELVSLEESLSCRFVSTHLPSTSRTEKLVNRDFIARMPSDGFLVHTSRPALIDPEAIAFALESDRLAGAAIDAELGPEASKRLLDTQRVILTPPRLRGSP